MTRLDGAGVLNRIGLCAATLICLFLLSCDGRVEPEAAVESPAPATPQIVQAKWKIKTYPTGAVGTLTGKDKKRIRAEKPRLKRLVEDVYDELFLSEGEAGKVIRTRFTPRAATALIRSGAGIPDRITNVKTTVRRARIGIGAASARQAAAQVWIRARAVTDSHQVRIVHHSTLWLQKSAGAWRAIAFDIKQGPVA